jgi:hypothetical protein
MFELMSVGLARPLVITGHDGAPNVVGGEREFHLLGVTADRARLRRVAPRTPSWRALRPFLVDAVLAPLGLDDEPGVYPGDWVAGPTGGEQLSRQGWRVSFTRQSGGAAASYGRRSAMNRWPSPVPGSAPRPSSSPSSYVPASATSPPGPTASLVAAASLVLSL